MKVLSAHFRRIVLGFTAAVAVGIPAVRGEIRVEPWRPVFTGVELAGGSADAAEPRLQRVKAVRVDLRAPGIELFSTPSNGPAPLETTSETVTEFLLHHRLQVAINANFFNPCCTPGDKDLVGLAISRGEVVSRPVAKGTGSAALVVTRKNAARIVRTTEGFQPGDYWTAVAGSTVVLEQGVKPSFPPTAFNTTAHPRTAVGVSRDGQHLIFLVIDGRQPAYSDGASMEEVAEWLRRFGAFDGLNLDGGGSSALVMSDGDRAITLNSPSGMEKPGEGAPVAQPLKRLQRSNGNNLGVWARPSGAVSLPK